MIGRTSRLVLSRCKQIQHVSPASLNAHFSTAVSSSNDEKLSPLLPGLSPEQIRKIGEMDTHLRSRHELIEGRLNPEEKDFARRKRIIYRSKQRGWLEADILLGAWAKLNVPSLTEQELDEYELVLKEETIDVYNYVSGKDPLPPHLKDLPIMKKLQAFALQRDLNLDECLRLTR